MVLREKGHLFFLQVTLLQSGRQEMSPYCRGQSGNSRLFVCFAISLLFELLMSQQENSSSSESSLSPKDVFDLYVVRLSNLAILVIAVARHYKNSEYAKHQGHSR